MQNITNIFARLWNDEDGAPATEYALLIAFIAIAAAVGMALLGTGLANIFTNIGNALGGISIAPLV